MAEEVEQPRESDEDLILIHDEHGEAVVRRGTFKDTWQERGFSKGRYVPPVTVRKTELEEAARAEGLDPEGKTKEEIHKELSRKAR